MCSQPSLKVAPHGAPRVSVQHWRKAVEEWGHRSPTYPDYLREGFFHGLDTLPLSSR